MSPPPRKVPVTGRARGAMIAIFIGVGFNALMFWMLAVWNRPQHFDPPIEPAARLIFTVDPSPPSPKIPKPSEPEPDEPPPLVMQIDLDFTPQPPVIEPLDLQLDLSVPSVDAVFVPVQVVTKPQPPAPQALAQTQSTQTAQTSREPLDAERVDQPPRELTNLQPAYPRMAERLRRTGLVQLRLLIDEAGRVEQVEVLDVQGHASFADAVLDVARRWRFDPARDRGRPVRVWATKAVRFELET